MPYKSFWFEDSQYINFIMKCLEARENQLKTNPKLKHTQGVITLEAFELLRDKYNLKFDGNNTSPILSHQERINNITHPELEYFREFISNYRSQKGTYPERGRRFWDKAAYLFPELENEKDFNKIIKKVEEELLK